MDSTHVQVRVPSGLSAIRGDLRTWFQMAGATTRREKLRVVLQSPALWGLAFYRWGRWMRDPEVRKPKPVAQASWVVYRALWPVVLWITRLFLTVHSEVEEDVWFCSHDSTWIGPGSRIGRGSRLYGGVTLGLAGRGENRGVPTLGRNVVLAPGVVLVGRISVPDQTVIGANASSARDVAHPGAWMGAPLIPWTEDASRLVPRV